MTMREKRGNINQRLVFLSAFLPFMHRFTHRRLFLVLMIFCMLGLAPGAGRAEEPSLVDRLLSLLGNKNLPRIDIPPPPAPAFPENASAPAKSDASPRAPALEIAQNFMPVYAFDRPDDDTPPVLPFFSSGPVNETHAGIITLVIMVHDQSREAAKAFAFARSAQDEASARHPEWNAPDSFIFAPQFLNSEDVTANATHWPDGGASLLRWTQNAWIYGQNSIAPEQNGIWQARSGISSYEVMDFMLLMLARPKIFPDLQKVVIAGTAEGGDFVQRYAALGGAPLVLDSEGIEVRFVPAQTRSFLYLDNYRLQARGDDPLTTKIETEAFAPAKTDTCKSINSYPYGMDDLPPYGKKNAVGEARLNYSGKRIIYLAGAGAGLPLHETTPDACALAAQGPTTARRNSIFFESLKRLYGDDVLRMQKLYLIDGINEDGLALWRSACGGAALFGDGGCNAEDTGNKAMQIIH